MLKNKLIGITGLARSGKDTAADYIISKFPEFKKYSFADPLKEMLRVGLDLSQDQLYGDSKHLVDIRYGRTPRHMMQTLGTEWGRDLINKNLWVSIAKQFVSKNDFIIVPDIRFESEASFIRESGVLIHVFNERVRLGDHRSEVGVNFLNGDYKVLNDGTINDFHDVIDSLIKCKEL